MIKPSRMKKLSAVVLEEKKDAVLRELKERGVIHFVKAEAGGALGPTSVGEGLSRAGIAMAAGLSVGIAAAGAGIGVGIIGSAALGAIAEKKEMTSWSFIFIALAEGVAFYGLIISFILIGKL
ncbi:MAG: hypothetical protein V3R86_01515 [Candidatus Hydrothermarchaeaceae archaeon]